MSQVMPLLIVLFVLVVVIQAILLWPRLKAEGWRLRLMKTQQAEQPLRTAVLQAQHDALQNRAPRGSAPGGSLLHRAAQPTDLAEPAADDPVWDSLLQYADQQ